MRDLRSAHLRLIIFMSILAACGAAIPPVVLAGADPAFARIAVD